MNTPGHQLFLQVSLQEGINSLGERFGYSIKGQLQSTGAPSRFAPSRCPNLVSQSSPIRRLVGQVGQGLRLHTDLERSHVRSWFGPPTRQSDHNKK